MKQLSKFVVVLLAFISFSLSINSQEVMVINKDTVITITPKNLKTINGIIPSFEWQKKEITTLDSIIKKDSVLLETKDSLLSTQLIREKKKEDFYVNQAKALASENATLKKKKKVGVRNAAGLGLIIGLLFGILL